MRAKLAAGTLAFSLIGLLGISSPAVAAPTAVAGQAVAAKVTVKKFKNCTALNKTYKHGVGKPGAKDKTSGKRVTNFKKSAALYNANKHLDRDKDGIACEKR
jgi:hypothetical protein